jgi:dTDP-4-amino-4,6-dideoxygalactose transaminase
MATRSIPLTRPATGDEEIREMSAVLTSGLLTQGPRVEAFEAAVAEVVNADHAIATTSATTALHLSLAGMGIGPGDEVLVPDYTFPATANVVIQQGATPVLVDIEAKTFTIDVDDLETKVTKASRAVIPVHAFGLSADMGGVNRVASEHDLLVVEDAACAMAADYRGRPVGVIGKAGCFSFHPRKSITTGEGGMITTDDASLADRLRRLRSHGGTRIGGRFVFEDVGFNYRLSDLLAAVGIAQLRKLDWLLGRRRHIADQYREMLHGREAIELPTEPSWGRHTYQSFVILLDANVDRDAVIRALAERGIETTIGTYALHREPIFRRTLGYVPGQLATSSDVFGRALTLPLYAEMSDDDVEYVAQNLSEVLDRPALRPSAARSDGLIEGAT